VIILKPDDLLALLAAGGALVAFAAITLAVGRVAGRRYKRRLKSIYDHALEGSAAAMTATQSLARVQSTTPNLDRVARRWLPRREILAARLARTGRSISIGQYALTMIGVAAAASGALIGLTSIGAAPAALLGVFLGLALPYLVVSRMGKRRLRRSSGFSRKPST